MTRMNAPRIDHVTYQINPELLHRWDVGSFMGCLGLEEVEPDELIEASGWDVRWWHEPEEDFYVHLVAWERPLISDLPSTLNDACYGLAHFCIEVADEAWEWAKRSRWRQFDLGRGTFRVWLRGPGGIRVEVRPYNWREIAEKESQS